MYSGPLVANFPQKSIAGLLSRLSLYLSKKVSGGSQSERVEADQTFFFRSCGEGSTCLTA